MTVDLVALCEEQPDRDAVLAALLVVGPAYGVRAHPSGALVELFDADDQPFFTVEGALLVQVPGEVERLLGLVFEPPVWWVEIRAVSGRKDALEAARRFASRLVAEAGGTVWPL